MPKHHGSLYDWIPGGNSFPFLISAVGSWLPAWQGRSHTSVHTSLPAPVPVADAEWVLG